MNSKIFRSSFFVAFMVLLVAVALIMGILLEFFENRIKDELKSEANYISHAIRTEGLDYFDGLETKKRISVIDFDGRVIYDSEADTSMLDNHSDRAEIRQAIKYGEGMSTRNSNVLSTKTMYYAVKLDDYILRVASVQSTAFNILLSLVQPFMVVLVLAVILCFVLSSRVSHAIIKPINALDLDNPESNEIYEELTPLLRKVAQQKRTIAKQIQSSLKESEDRETMRREFTANVSHELKTPLTSISGFAELMSNGGIPDETVADFSTSIYNEAQRLIALVNDIIQISELEDKNITYKLEAVDLYSLCSDILKRLEPVAKQRNINMQLTGSSTTVYGVKKIIDEMIYNLCDNAVKYNVENGQIDVILTPKTIVVHDTGIGIPESEQARVFERFYRVDKSHSKTIGGTGLGLAIVKHGAMYHNAELVLDSAVNKGTSVKIIFNNDKGVSEDNDD